MSTGTIDETYVAALQHELVSLSGEEHLVGVVRRPTGWFRGAVDENRPDLGPPEALLDEVQARKDDLQMRGMCEEGAHNAAWEETDFAARYREYLDDSPEAQAAVDGLAARVRNGEDVVLVCYEGEGKRCHRHLLEERLKARIDGT